jgi:lysophospholipase L1-like esterase
LTVRNVWKDGAIERGPGQYSRWSADIARSAAVPFLDVTNAIADQYEKLGPDKVKQLFPEDNTHTSPAGAQLVASIVVSTIKGASDLPLASYLSDQANSVDAYPARLPAKIPLPSPKDPSLPSLFLIGDSTVRNGRGDGANGQWGWGEPLVDLFDTSKINVVNRAVGGLSSRTYYTNYWQDTLAMIKPGDFVTMQFGHNDGGPLDDAARARGTLRGVGDETREIDNPITRQHETVHTYGWYLRQFIADARAKGATPIMCTLIPRKTWKDGKIVRNGDSYAGWARQVAADEHVPVIDLNEMIAARYDTLGPDKVDPLFGDPHTHTSRAGAELNAQIVVEGFKALLPDPLAAYLR